MKKTTKKVEEKAPHVHMVLAELNMGSRKAEIFDAVIGAFLFLFMLTSGVIVLVSIFALGFTWGKLLSLILDIVIAWFWYYTSRR